MWGSLSSGAVIWLWQVGSEEEMLMLGIWRRLYSPSGVGPVAALAERDVSAAGVVPLDHLLRVFHHSAWIMKLLSIPFPHSRTLRCRYGAGLIFSAPFSWK